MAKTIYRGSTPHFRLTTNHEIDVGAAVVLVAQKCSCHKVKWEVPITLDDDGAMTFALTQEQTLDLNTHANVLFQLKVEQAGEVCYSNVRSRQVIDALDTGERVTASGSNRSRNAQACGCECCGCELSFTIDSEFVVMGEYEVYEGETEVTPSFATQVLETANKVMKSDVTVHPIEVSETPNAAGGKTLIIG